MLTRLAFTNFRCFKERQELELRPVTVVLGKNNSGKSALTRAAMVFRTGFTGDTVSRRRAPLDLDRLGRGMFASFTDLVYRHSPHGSVTVELTFDDETVKSVTAEIQNIDGARLQVVTRSEVVLDRGTLLLKWAYSGDTYSQHWTGPDGVERITAGSVAFHGLVPDRLPDAVGDAGFSLSSHCAAAFGRIRYLSPMREAPRREHYLPVGEPDGVGDSGEHVASVLADDEVRRGGRVRRRVNELMQDILPDWTLDEVPDGRLFTTVLRSKTDPLLAVGIADAGSGVSQVLPILVQQALDELAGDTGPGLHIVEEPELHLHPAAHAQLADLYLKAAKSTGSRFLLETHSEALLLRLRRRIAEEQVSPDDVGIYFVHHDGRSATAHRIEVDGSGRLSWWPEGVFTEDFEEVRALTAAQLRRSGVDVA